MTEQIPFNKPYICGQELEYISDTFKQFKLAGDGKYTKLCSQYLEQSLGTPKSLLTHSCTAALEMAAILCETKPGDEVIMPSFTFVSTANAFVLRGAKIKFADIDPDTFNLCPQEVEKLLSKNTKTIVPVHYAGVACDMDRFLKLADSFNLNIVEDAAQAFGATYKGKPLGTLGRFGALSFHETKNIIAGEGGALLLNHQEDALRSEIIREKGTNRAQFFRGEIDKYTWVDIGSSFLPSELIAAFLWAQLEKSQNINLARKKIWQQYHEHFADLERKELVRRPFIPEYSEHNAHMYYLVFKNLDQRTRVQATLKQVGIQTTFHYVPLHSSPAGRKYGEFSGPMKNTQIASDCLLRLPLWVGMESKVEVIAEHINRLVLKD